MPLHSVHDNVSPSSDVFDEMVAAGPVPASVMALTWKVYEVNGLKSDTSQEVASVFRTGICDPTGPLVSILYPVMIPFRFSIGIDAQESSALVE